MVLLAKEIGRVNLLAALVGLLFHAFQICSDFIGRTGHITLGIPTLSGAEVVLKIFAT